MLYVSIGSDGGGVVLSGMDDIDVVDLRSNEKNVSLYANDVLNRRIAK